LRQGPGGAAESLPQARVEELLAEDAVDLGAEIRRGHEVIAVTQVDDPSIARPTLC
jgi:hypothetical protein